MPRFRKRPVTIEAMQFGGGVESARAVLDWMKHGGHTYRPGVNRIFIKTLEGTMEAAPSDWIIRGVKGELYPIKDVIFRETYDPEDDGAG